MFIIYLLFLSNHNDESHALEQELMKMEGVSVKTIFVAHFLNILPGGLVYSIGYLVTMKISDNDNPIFPYTNSLLIFLTLVLHFLSIIPWAFIGAYLINARELLFVMLRYVFKGFVSKMSEIGSL